MIACFVVNLDGDIPQTLLLRRASHDAYSPGTWQMVYGHRDENETPELTVLREVAEETGLQVSELYTLDETLIFYDIVYKCMQLTPIFVAVVDSKRAIRLDLGEHTDYEWVDFGPARQMLAWPSQRRALDQLAELLVNGGLPAIMRLDISKSEIASEK